VVIGLFIGIGAAELLRLHLYEVASASQRCLRLHFLSLCIILGRTTHFCTRGLYRFTYSSDREVQQDFIE